ncbi:MAG: cbb3-type cytochrome oxidase assembly protein CcoS [Xanthomonadales bacterium]|jgi:cbb3-type cytochrome oxidase maturation protein|nr:cbb3-type cytochrome oxidase assembly protein CcoS [Xanthomonadales bacterium]MBK7145115.1 cbb3-type cytochrome oxidase assembly protein CcoS [Xanthomonadales bacterium]MCC6561425.1 cbb3-type cytochrome oxidase assembly protein CcoS [Xanthomonadales bacterium]
MNILLILVPVSLLLVGLALYAFFWAVDNGQFDDLDRPGFDPLEDDAGRNGDA